jgi:CheY-like chemotaxis protein/sensor domain CHASE-containing protein
MSLHQGEKKNSSIGFIMVALPFLIIAIASVLFFLHSTEVSSKERELCSNIADRVAEDIKQGLAGLIDKGNPLVQLLEKTPNPNESLLSSTSTRILEGNKEIIGISIAPGAVIRYYYPSTQGESLIGHDLLSNPERRDALVRSVEKKKAIVSGPLESVDGEEVLFLRYPVFIQDSLWGFASLTVNFNGFIESLNLSLRFPSVDLAISTIIGLDNADTESLEATAANRQIRLFSGKPFVAEHGIESTELTKAGIAWVLHVLPLHGWSSIDPYLYALLGLCIISAFFIFFSLLLGNKQGRPIALPSKVKAAVPSQSSLLDDEAEDSIDAHFIKKSQAHYIGTIPIQPKAYTNNNFVNNVDSTKPNLEIAKAKPSKTSEASENSSENSSENGEYLFPDLSLIEKKRGRAVTFIGPDVKGELYMPERLVVNPPIQRLLVEESIESQEAKDIHSPITSENSNNPVQEQAGHDLYVETGENRDAEAGNILPKNEEKQYPQEPFTTEPSKHGEAIESAESAVVLLKNDLIKSTPWADTVSRDDRVFELVISNSKANEVELLEPSILVVDDSEVNRDIVERMLAASNLSADFADSGEAALKAAKNKSYDIILMDCFMPGMDGYKTSSMFRSMYPQATTQIVGMSARTSPQELDHCRVAGMNELLVKPFTMRQLLGTVTKLVKK